MNQSSDILGQAGKAFKDLHTRQDLNSFWGSAEMFILIAALLLVAIALFVWAAFIRKPRKNSIAKPLASGATGPSSRKWFKNKRRRERRWNRRNPTLSETGGLPPRKSEESVSNSR